MILLQDDQLATETTEQPLSPSQQPSSASADNSRSGSGGSAAAPSGVHAGIDFLAFGADVMVEKKTTQVPKKKLTRTVIENLQTHEPAETQGSFKKRKYLHDFEGILDDIECEEIEQTLAEHTSSSAASSSVVGSGVCEPDQQHSEPPEPDHEKAAANLNLLL